MAEIHQDQIRPFTVRPIQRLGAVFRDHCIEFILEQLYHKITVEVGVVDDEDLFLGIASTSNMLVRREE
jgi:hypothetical protein